MKYTEEQLHSFYIEPCEYEYRYCTYCKCEVPVRIEEFEDETEETLTITVTCEVCESRLQTEKGGEF